MSDYIHKRHNVSVLLYHIVCPAKYRRVVFDEEVDRELKNICLEIAERFEINFLEVGTDKDHVHFLVQSVPVNDGVILHQWSPIKEVKWAVEKCTIGCHFMVRVSSSCEGVKDVQSGVVRKGTQGVYC